MKGRESAKRALEIAAAGGHNLLMLWSRYGRQALANFVGLFGSTEPTEPPFDLMIVPLDERQLCSCP